MSHAIPFSSSDALSGVSIHCRKIGLEAVNDAVLVSRCHAFSLFRYEQVRQGQS